MRLALIIASLGSLVFVQSAIGNDWETDHAKAIKLAKSKDRYVLAFFTGSDWCGWCVKLQEEVFAKGDFKRWASRNVVLLELDFPKKKTIPASLVKQNQRLAKTHRVEGFPTVLLLDHDGKEVARTGYVNGGAKAWISDIEKKIKIAEASAQWNEDFEKARAKAKKANKFLLVNFTGSNWCHWCVRLDGEVFSTPEFANWAQDNAILVKLDFPRDVEQDPSVQKQNQRLAEKFGITGYPTILFLTDKAREIGRIGYVTGGPSAWIKKAESLLEDAR